MKIIAFEGLDKSGKETQSKMLLNYLVKQNKKAELYSFPRYNTEIGKIIKDYLHGEIDWDRHTFELLMALDKQAFQHDIRVKNSYLDYLIFDRYILSQKVYSLAGMGVRKQLIEELQYYMIRPDITLLLDIPVNESMSRKGKFEKNDIYERDEKLLHEVRLNYINEAQRDNNVIIINGKQNIDEIHDTIISVLKFREVLE